MVAATSGRMISQNSVGVNRLLCECHIERWQHEVRAQMLSSYLSCGPSDLALIRERLAPFGFVTHFTAQDDGCL